MRPDVCHNTRLRYWVRVINDVLTSIGLFLLFLSAITVDHHDLVTICACLETHLTIGWTLTIATQNRS